MENHLVHARANGCWITVIAFLRGNGSLAPDDGLDGGIDFRRGRPRDEQGLHFLEDQGHHAAGLTDEVDFAWRLDDDH